MDVRRSELFNLSNKLIEIYIQDVFAKNNEDLNELKARITDEQKESIKSSVMMLKEQVDDFLHKNNSENNEIENDTDTQSNISPLRKKLLGEGQKKIDDEDSEN